MRKETQDSQKVPTKACVINDNRTDSPLLVVIGWENPPGVLPDALVSLGWRQRPAASADQRLRHCAHAGPCSARGVCWYGALLWRRSLYSSKDQRQLKGAAQAASPAHMNIWPIQSSETPTSTLTLTWEGWSRIHTEDAGPGPVNWIHLSLRADSHEGTSWLRWSWLLTLDFQKVFKHDVSFYI